MAEANLILTSISKEDLSLMIRDAIRIEISEHLNNQPKKVEVTYLTRKETAFRLRVSLPTLHLWSKEGTVKAYTIGGRVLYKTEEIEGLKHSYRNQNNY